MNRILVLSIAILLIACSDPHSTVLSVADSDKEKVQDAMKKLPEEERELVAGYMMRTMVVGAFAGKPELPTGVTIGDAIKKQKAWVEEQKVKQAEADALAAKLKAEREAAEKQMNDTVTVTLVSKKVAAERGYSGIVMDEHLNITVGYQNNSDKAIAGVKGALTVYDIFDKEITVFRISNDQDIQSGKTITWEGGRSLKYGMKSTDDKKFAYMDEGKYKVRWKPEVIIFKDGSSIKSQDD